jgi:hypothetical protein
MAQKVYFSNGDDDDNDDDDGDNEGCILQLKTSSSPPENLLLNQGSVLQLRKYGKSLMKFGK